MKLSLRNLSTLGGHTGLIISATLIALLLTLYALSYPIEFTIMGILGAIFANSTGAGGGVVFLPVFAQLGFDESQSIATSFGIQCFGMTAGAITWYRYYQQLTPEDQANWRAFYSVVAVCSVCSIAGILTNFGLQLQSFESTFTAFRLFTLLLGLCIASSLLLRPNGSRKQRLNAIDWLVLIVITYCGGILTGWLSVAVGEIIAFYLIFRRFEASFAIACAVVVTAFTVWSVAPITFAAQSTINWQVVAYAGPGAVIGGILARRLATYMPHRVLKGFFAACLVLIAVAG